MVAPQPLELRVQVRILAGQPFRKIFMKDITAIVLAAGRGTRMKSDVPKVMHELLGKPLIEHILDSIREAGVKDIIVVAGYGSETLKVSLKGAKVVLQKKLLGSGDAVNTVRPLLKGFRGNILIACGDTPLLKNDTIRNLVGKHKASRASATVLTVRVKDPSGYGRILRDDDGKFTGIVEEEDAPIYEKVIEEINVGTYCFRAEDLFDALSSVRPDNKKGEYYLTDVIRIMNREKKTVESFETDDPGEALGVNTRKDLAHAALILKTRVMEGLMDSGVTVEDPSSTVVYPGAKIGPDSVIRPNTMIESDVTIGRNCSIGPFARIRPGVYIGDNVEVGNFVELVRTSVGDNSKIKHHTYFGDTTIGKNVNVGAGTIVANFDGVNKNRTVIEDGAFIGIGSRMIAPVRIGRGAVLGAGCVVPKNHDVPKGVTVVGVPARQVHKKKISRRAR